jgi:hypothetical protein
MRVILTDTQKGESYKFTLNDKYIKTDDVGDVELPSGDGYRFYSPGYVYRLTERAWDDFEDPPSDLVERVRIDLTQCL